MILQRQQDWRSRLVAWAEEMDGQPFVWGQTDCASLARAALVILFGQELVEDLPAWNTAREALTVLDRQVGGIPGVLERLGAKRMPVPFMRAGDILVAGEPEEEVGSICLMVCIDGRRCLATTRDGVGFSVPSPEAIAYSLWEVSRG